MKPLTPGQQKILDALAGGDKTRHELALITGLNKETLGQKGYIKDLIELSRVYICGWTRIDRHIIPVYRIGKGKNVPKIPPLTGTQKQNFYVESHLFEVNFKRRMRSAKKSNRPMAMPVKDKTLIALGAFKASDRFLEKILTEILEEAEA